MAEIARVAAGPTSASGANTASARADMALSMVVELVDEASSCSEARTIARCCALSSASRAMSSASENSDSSWASASRASRAWDAAR